MGEALEEDMTWCFKTTMTILTCFGLMSHSATMWYQLRAIMEQLLIKGHRQMRSHLLMLQKKWDICFWTSLQMKFLWTFLDMTNHLGYFRNLSSQQIGKKWAWLYRTQQQGWYFYLSREQTLQYLSVFRKLWINHF